MHINNSHTVSMCICKYWSSQKVSCFLYYKHHFKHLWVLRSSRKTISTDFFWRKREYGEFPLYRENPLSCILRPPLGVPWKAKIIFVTWRLLKLFLYVNVREGSHYQIGWFFGKTAFNPTPPHFWKIILQFFIMNMVTFMQGGIGQIISVNIS